MLEERKKVTEAYNKRIKREFIDQTLEERRNQLLRQWNNMNFQKEYNTYLKQIDYFKWSFNSDKTILHDYNGFGNIQELFKRCNMGFEFVGGQYKLAEYIVKFAKSDFDGKAAMSNIQRMIVMSHEEARMFKAFSEPTLKNLEREMELKS